MDRSQILNKVKLLRQSHLKNEKELSRILDEINSNSESLEEVLREYCFGERSSIEEVHVNLFKTNWSFLKIEKIE